MQMQNAGGGIALIAALILIVLLAFALLGGCDALATQDRQAQRIEARADLVRAQAAADSERASVRQMERDAAQERALTWLPYLVTVGGGLIVLIVLLLIAWDIRSTRGAIHPDLRAYLELQDRRLDLLERQSQITIPAPREVLVIRRTT